MKIQNIIRMQVAIIGFGAALLMASAAPAQEISNSEWAESQNATESVQVAQAPATTNAQTAQTPVVVANAKQAATTEAGVAQPFGGDTLAFVLISIVGLSLYVVSEVKRISREFAPHATQVDRSASLS